MSLLDGVLLKIVQQNGSSFEQRRSLNFLSGATVVDNPTNNSTDISISGGGGGGGGGQINLTLANGVNSNVTTDGSALQVIGGPTGSFSLGGLTPSLSLSAGQFVVFSYTGGQPWSVVHLDPSSSAGNRIFVPGQSVAGAKVPIFGSLLVQKDTTNGRLIAVSLGSSYKNGFDPREFGAACDGVTDDTVALQACLDACVAALDAGTPGARVVLPGWCVISAPITVTRASGLVIDGVGVGSCGFQEIGIGGQGLAGQLGMFIWKNCRNCLITDRVGFFPSVHWGVISTAIPAGSLSVTCSAFFFPGVPVIGQRVTLSSQSNARFSEEIIVRTSGATSATFARPTQYPYAIGDIVGFGVEAGPVSYNTWVTQFTGSVTPSGNSITFGTSQTMPQGSALCFVSQPHKFYYLASAVSGTSGTLTSTFNGPAGATTSQQVLNATANTFLGTVGSQGVYHAQKGALSTPRGGGPAFLANNILGVTVSSLTGTALVLSGPVSMPLGATLNLSSQPNVFYQLAGAMVASSTGTLTASYTGTSAVGAAVTQNAAVSVGDTTLHLVEASPGGLPVGLERGICPGQILDIQGGPTGGTQFVKVASAPTWNATTLCWDVPLVSAVINGGVTAPPYPSQGYNKYAVSSQDDANNDEMVFGGYYTNILLGAIAFEGLNALQNTVPSCTVSGGASAFWLPRGGSVQVLSANIGLSNGGAHLIQGGFCEHLTSLFGIVGEDTSAMIYIPQVLTCVAPRIIASSYDAKGGPAVMALANNATVNSGSASITFGAAVTLPIGTHLSLGTDPTNLYQLQSAVNNSTSGTMTQTYQGAGSGVSTSVQYTQRTIDVFALGINLNIYGGNISPGGIYVQDPLGISSFNLIGSTYAPSDVTLGNIIHQIDLPTSPLIFAFPVAPYLIGAASISWGGLFPTASPQSGATITVQSENSIDLTASAISVTCPLLAIGQSVSFQHVQFDPGTHAFTLAAHSGTLFGAVGSSTTSSTISMNTTSNYGFAFTIKNLGRLSGSTPVYAMNNS